MDGGKKPIEKFDGSDSGFCRMQIEYYLYGKDLWQPLESKLTEMKDAYSKVIDRKTMSVVRLSLSRMVAFHIAKETTNRWAMVVARGLKDDTQYVRSSNQKRISLASAGSSRLRHRSKKESSSIESEQACIEKTLAGGPHEVGIADAVQSEVSGKWELTSGSTSSSQTSKLQSIMASEHFSEWEHALEDKTLQLAKIGDSDMLAKVVILEKLKLRMASTDLGA